MKQDDPSVVSTGQKFILVTSYGPFVYIWNSEGKLEYCIRQRSNVLSLAIAPSSNYKNVEVKSKVDTQQDEMFNN
jgi:hypothetical protein